MRWLITGGCGFIGRNLIRSLIADGVTKRIRVVDNLSVGSRSDLAQICPVVLLDSVTLTPVEPVPEGIHVELVVGDIKYHDLAMRSVHGFPVIVHLAADTGVASSVADPLGSCVTNVIGTLNYLEAARGCGATKFIFASSGAPIGECEPPLHEELPAHPVSPYGASKLCGEAYCSAYKHSFGLDTVCLRFSNVYGSLSGHKGSIVAKFIRDAIDGRNWEIFGDGSQTRDFICIDDLVGAIKLAAFAGPGVGGEVFQIASGMETSVNDLAERLRRILSKFGITVNDAVHLPPRVGDVKRNFSDPSKAHRLLGWKSKINLDQGLDQTVKWFIEPISGTPKH